MKKHNTPMFFFAIES